MRNILTVMGMCSMNICLAVNPVSIIDAGICNCGPFSCAVDVMQLDTHNYLLYKKSAE
jgi:hypothetical protein